MRFSEITSIVMLTTSLIGAGVVFGGLNIFKLILTLALFKLFIFVLLLLNNFGIKPILKYIFSLLKRMLIMFIAFTITFYFLSYIFGCNFNIITRLPIIIAILTIFYIIKDIKNIKDIRKIDGTFAVITKCLTLMCNITVRIFKFYSICLAVVLTGIIIYFLYYDIGCTCLISYLIWLYKSYIFFINFYLCQIVNLLVLIPLNFSTVYLDYGLDQLHINNTDSLKNQGISYMKPNQGPTKSPVETFNKNPGNSSNTTPSTDSGESWKNSRQGRMSLHYILNEGKGKEKATALLSENSDTIDKGKKRAADSLDSNSPKKGKHEASKLLLEKCKQDERVKKLVFPYNANAFDMYFGRPLNGSRSPSGTETYSSSSRNPSDVKAPIGSSSNPIDVEAQASKKTKNLGNNPFNIPSQLWDIFYNEKKPSPTTDGKGNIVYHKSHILSKTNILYRPYNDRIYYTDTFFDDRLIRCIDDDKSGSKRVYDVLDKKPFPPCDLYVEIKKYENDHRDLRAGDKTIKKQVEKYDPSSKKHMNKRLFVKNESNGEITYTGKKIPDTSPLKIVNIKRD